jgi:hypothetical protein
MDNIKGFARQEVICEVDYILGDILQRIRQHPVQLYVRGKRQSVPFIDAAQTCRMIRNVSAEFNCDKSRDKGRGCIHAETASSLEQLQKHALQEIKTNACLAVGKRLPRELVDVIIENTLVLEGIPQDPIVDEFDEPWPWFPPTRSGRGHGRGHGKGRRRLHKCPYGGRETRYRDYDYY